MSYHQLDEEISGGFQQSQRHLNDAEEVSEDMATINIKGIDKATLLAALYNNASPWVWVLSKHAQDG